MLRFLLVVCIVIAMCPSVRGGEIHGVVRYEGPVPKQRDADDSGRRRALFSVEGKSGGLGGAVVFLELAAGNDVALPAYEPDDAAAVIMQRDFTFEPHITVIAPGQRVIFGNDDPANHNVRGDAEESRNAFNVITTPEQTYEKTFAPETGRAIRLACDVHPWMAGWIYVFAHRLFAVTDEAGAFVIGDVPEGEYVLRVEQPDGGLRAEGVMRARGDESIELKVSFALEHLNDGGSPAIRLVEPE